MAVSLPTSDPLRNLNIESFDTRTFLAHAAAQARKRRFGDMFIVDVDAHHHENYSYRNIANYIEDPVIRHRFTSSMGRRSGSQGFFPSNPGDQDMAGRLFRHHTRDLEPLEPGVPGDVTRTQRWMDCAGIDIAMLFPTSMLGLGTHPHIDVEILFARAYNRFMCEEILPHEPRIRALLYLPFNDAEASYRMVQDFGDKPGVSGFMITASHEQAVHDNRYMKTYAALEERNLALCFHGIYNWKDSSFRTMNRFLSVHALGFVYYNMLHMINWIINGIPERFPQLKVIWMESGLAYLPFVMQRLDNEFNMRSNEAPALKARPSEYMRRMYYGTQPMETDNLRALECTMEMIGAETQLCYSSDYPHWDFDLPTVVYDLPFLDEQAKRNILGLNAARLFNITDTTKLAKIPGS